MPKRVRWKWAFNWHKVNKFPTKLELVTCWELQRTDARNHGSGSLVVLLLLCGPMCSRLPRLNLGIIKDTLKVWLGAVRVMPSNDQELSLTGVKFRPHFKACALPLRYFPAFSFPCVCGGGGLVVIMWPPQLYWKAPFKKGLERGQINCTGSVTLPFRQLW